MNHLTNKTNIDYNLVIRILLFFSAIFIIQSIVQDIAFAAPGDQPNPLQKPICAVALFFTGTFGIAIGVVGIGFVGLQLFTGRMQWVTAGTIILAIICVTKADTIIAWISGNDTSLTSLCQK